MDQMGEHIIVLGHGSKVPEANQSVKRLAQEVSGRTGVPAGCAFLEMARPNLAEAVSAAAAAGARRVIVIPCFVAMGTHVRQDLPRMVAEVRAAAPQLEIVLGQPLEGHPQLAEIVADRVREAAAQFPACANRQPAAGKG